MKNIFAIIILIIAATSANAQFTGGNGDGFSMTNKVSSFFLIPMVDTETISSITLNTASGGGDFLIDNGYLITVKGVVWSTTTNPTLTTNEAGHTEDGTGSDSYTSSITGLSANTTYYVRAYATNSEGTAYGNEVSFTTKKIIYVDASKTSGSNNGTTWANAYTSFQSALNAATSGDQIWVAKGIYNPSQDYDLGDESNPRLYHFRMIEGVGIYGGFAGTETAVSQRTDFGSGGANETILSGDIGTEDVNTDNCYHVFYHPSGLGLTTAAILDGFTITGGNANGSNPHNSGGGIYNHTNSPEIKNCIFTRNYGFYGGGIFNSNSSTELTNTLLYLNDSQNGGALYESSTSTIITNCTIYSNSAGSGSSGGGIYITSSSSSIIINNSIIWANSSWMGKQMYIHSGSASLNYSCYSNGVDDIYKPLGSTLSATNNNITSDPLIANQSIGNYRLVVTSPCIDAGSNAYCTETYDIRGTGFGRKLNKTTGEVGTIDMGCYEFKAGTDPVGGNTIYVKHDAVGNNDGSSWTDAYISLYSALNSAIATDQIWVSKGTYKPSYAYSLTNTSRYYHFRMIANVKIFGGFAGTETASDQRTDFGEGGANETILSGDIGTEGSNTDNCYHVFYHPSGLGLTTNAVLDGFTVTGGNANGTAPHQNGGGIFNDLNSPLIRNCIIKGNRATNGGGLFNAFSITNSIISGNNATLGGGIYNAGYYSSPIITNSTIISNNANYGGGLYNTSSSSSTLNNSIIWGNTASTNGKQLYQDGGTTTLNYSCYSNGTGDIYTISGGVLTATNNNITSDPLFANPTNNDFRLVASSPCLDAGDDSYCTEPYDIRGAGYDRKLNKTTGEVGTIDMGANEFKAGTDPVGTPLLTTTTITSITNNSASSGGIVLYGYASSVTARGVVWSTTTTPALTTNEAGYTENGTGTGTFTSSITSLSPNTIYYVRAYATNSEGTAYGNEVSFRTLAAVPSAPTVNNPTITTLDVAVNVNSNPAGTEFAIQETGGNYVQADGSLSASAVWQTASTWSTITVTGLSANTQYTFQVKARNGDNIETAFGGTTALYTLANVPSAPTVNNPTITTLDVVINVNSNPAGTEFAIQETGGNGRYVQTDGSLGDDGGAAVWQTEAQWEVNAGNTVKTVTGLSANTQYTFQVKARNGNNTETAFGATANGTTLPQAPTVTTQAVSSIATTTATGNGNITSLGVPNPTDHGVVYHTSTNPTTANSVVDNGAASSTGAFTASITGLTPNTQYFVKAYATNTAGTVYGDEVNFYTLANVPNAPTVNGAAITTLDVAINVNSNPAGTEFAIQETGGNGRYVQTDGSLGDDSGAAVWQTEAQWEVNAGNTVKTVTGLSANTQYTFQVKARNGDNVETAFGATASGTTLPQAPTVTTQAVDNIAATTATGNGNITSLGIPNPTAHGVVYHTSSNPTTANSVVDNAASNSTGAYTASITGLTPNTQYFVKAYATNTAGTVYGDEVNFYTLANVPSAPTVDAPTTSSLNVAINSNSNSSSTTYLIYESVTAQIVQLNGSLAGSNVWQTETAWESDATNTAKTVTGLYPNTLYTFTVTARNGGNVETSPSSSTSLYTLANTPSTMSFVSHTKTSIDIQINPNSNPAGTEYAIYNGTQYLQANGTFAVTEAWQTEAQWESTSGNLRISGLTAGATYNWQVKAKNGDDVETALSTALATKTLPNQASNVSFTNITSNTFDINWTRGNGAEVRVFLKVATSGSASPADGTNYGANTVFPNGLEIGSTGWFCVYAGNGTTVNVTGVDNANNVYTVHVVEYISFSGYTYRYNTEYSTSTAVSKLSPTSQASNIQFSNISRTGMTVRWTRGNGEGSVLLGRMQYRIPATPLTDGVEYSVNANANYTAAPTVSGAKVLYFGDAANPSVTVTGLTRYQLVYYRVCEFNNGNTPAYLQTEVSGNPSSRWTLRRDGMMEEDLSIDAEYPYPNPVANNITVILDVFEAGNVSAKLYDITGSKIIDLYNAQLSFGTHELTFDLSTITSGTYQLVISKGSEAVVYPLSVVK